LLVFAKEEPRTAKTEEVKRPPRPGFSAGAAAEESGVPDFTLSCSLEWAMTQAAGACCGIFFPAAFEHVPES